MPYGQGQGDNYQSIRVPFNLRGLDLVHPIDKLEQGYYPHIENLRGYVDGELQTRPGITLIKSLTSSLGVGETINSIYYFTDDANDDFCYIVGSTAGKIYRVDSVNAVTIIATGLSGARLTFVAMRPDRSPEAYLYVGDTQKFYKIKFDGTVQNAGIEQLPTTPITRAEAPNVLEVDDFLSANPETDLDRGNFWNKSVYASTLTQINRTNTTIAEILYDNDGSGYACISPVLFDTSIAFHQRVKLGTGGTEEFVVIEQITNKIADTEIESIVYETGVTGKFTAVLVENSMDLVPNCLLEIDSELIRVEAVIQGPDNKFAFKAQSTGTLLAGDPVTGFQSFRAKCAFTHSPGEAINCKAFESIITGGPTTTGFWGNIRHNAARDWSIVGGKPVQDNDEITIGIYLSDPSLLKEMRVWAIVEPSVTTTYNADDADKNYYSVSFRPDDLIQYATDESMNTQLSTTFGRIQRQQYDEFNQAIVDQQRDIAYKQSLVTAAGGKRGLFGRLLQKSLFPATPAKVGANDTAQANSGMGQWYQIRFPVGLLKSQRVGGDSSVNLKNIKSIMVNFFVADEMTVAISSWWIGSGAGPSTLDLGTSKENNGYFYLTVARNNFTGDQSLPSPPTRTGVIGLRQEIKVTVPMHPDPQVTNVDIYRYGGTLFNWHYLGTVANTPEGPDVEFTDDIPDERIQFNRLLTFDDYAPFPTSDLPRRGRCDVVGSVVTRIAGAGNDDFNTEWAPGNDITINGLPYLLYGAPESSARLELSESAGTLVDVEWEMNSPLIRNTHLPTIIGPYASPTYGTTYFALGDSRNPGVLYWAKGNNPGSANETGYYEVSSPTQPLIAGMVYDGRVYVYSSEYEYMIVEDGAGGFVSQPVANTKGAVSPYGAASSQMQFHIGKDGIYVAEGGQPRSLTDPRLYKLFPHDGQAGENSTFPYDGSALIHAPDYTRADEFQLIATGDGVYFIYPCLAPHWHCLRYDNGLQAWTFDTYGRGGVNTLHYATGRGIYRILVGTDDGDLAYLTGSKDIDEPIRSELHTPVLSGRNERAKQRFGDMTINLNSERCDTSITPYTDFYETQQLSSLITSNNRAERIVDLLQGDALYAQNLGIVITHNGETDIPSAGTAAKLRLYSWQLAMVEKPEITGLRATDWQAAPGSDGSRFYQGFRLEADTFGEDLEVRIEYDGGQLGETLTINHDGQIKKDYSFDQPFIAQLVRVIPAGADEWRLFNIQWISEPTPSNGMVWETQPTDHGTCGWKHIPAMYVCYSSPDPVELTINIDGVDQLPVYTLPAQPVKDKYYLRLRPNKGKIYSYRFESTVDFQLYVQETCIFIGAWGRKLSEGYEADKPFGGASRENGALI